MSRSKSARRPYGTGSVYIKGNRWLGRWYSDGKPRKLSLGPTRTPHRRDGLTKRQAEAKLQKAMAETLAAPALGERVSVREAAEAYIAHCRVVKRLKPTTIADYRVFLGHHIEPRFGDRALTELTTSQIEKWQATMLADGSARQSVLNRLNFLSGLCNFGLRRGWLRSNPVVQVERPKQQRANRDLRFLEPSDVARVIGAIPGDDLGRIDRLLYAAATSTGMRQGELAALRWRDVDWLSECVRVRRSCSRGHWGTPKSLASQRETVLPNELAVELERHSRTTLWQDADDLVFAHPSSGNPYDASRMRKRWQARLAEAGVRPVRFHSMRHTFGVSMARQNIPLAEIQRWMGHASIQTTMIYAAYAPNQSRGSALASEAFGGMIEGINAPSRQVVSTTPEPLGEAQNAVC